jgi:hypothetical protein
MPQIWEYQTLLHSPERDKSEDLEETLNSWGGRGWEAVGMVQELCGQVGSQADPPGGLFTSSIIVLMKRPKS